MTTTTPHDPIETFLSVNAEEIPATDRAALRAIAAKYIKGEAPLNLDACPEHLRDSLRRIVVQAAYEHRCAGQVFNPKTEVMPSQGISEPSKLMLCRI